MTASTKDLATPAVFGLPNQLTTARLALANPETWWPIEQDYFIDDFQFRLNAPLPVRVDLKTGNVRVLDRRSPFSLYDISIGGFTMGSDYNQKDAEGFINILGLPVKMAALKAAGRPPV